MEEKLKILDNDYKIARMIYKNLRGEEDGR